MRHMRPALIDSLRNYSWKTFRADLFAGLTVGVVALPLSMAFAIACNLPPEMGLYTAITAGAAAAICGGSHTQISGPTGAFVILISAAVVKYGVDGLAVITFLAGIILVLLGVFKAGGMIKYIPFPVVIGFTSGIAVVIFSTQFKDIFGFREVILPSEFAPKVVDVIKNLNQANPAAIGLTVLTVVTIVCCRRYFPRCPAMLLGMLLATAVAMLFKLNVETIGERFGDLPRTLPSPQFPVFDYWLLPDLIKPALTIAMLAAIESLLSATVADSMSGKRHNSDMELTGQGIGNLLSVLFGGIPATGAIARTATNIKSGGQTPVAALIHAATLAVIMLVFAPWAKQIPLAGLAGILVVVCYNMSEWRTFVEMFKSPKSDWSIMITTFILTVFVDLVTAVAVGVALAALLFIKRMSDSTSAKILLKELENDANYDDLAENEQYIRELPSQIDIFEVQGAFFFGAIEPFRNEVLRLFDRNVKVIILRLRHVPAIDATALNVVRNFALDCRRNNIMLVISGIQEQPLKAFEKSGLDKIIGKENIFNHIKPALKRAEDLIK